MNDRVMMQASKKIPFEDPRVLMGVRTLYVISNLIIAGIYLYAQQQINKKKGMYSSSGFVHQSLGLFLVSLNTAHRASIIYIRQI